jgi:hypothetical protein
MMRNLSCIYSLDILYRLKPGCTRVLTEQFAPGAGELMFFNTWSVLNSPLCPGGWGGGVVLNKNTLIKPFCEAFVVEFYLKLKLILRIISYLTYICWEIDNFVIKSDIFRRFFICKNILKKLSCYHNNYFRYFMFGKYSGFVSKARVSACMYFLVT